MADQVLNQNPTFTEQQPREVMFNPTLEEKADIDLVMKSLDSAREARKKWDKNWDTYERYYDGVPVLVPLS